MNCETIAEYLPGMICGELDPTQLAECKQHISQCSECRDALRGAESLALLKSRDAGDVPDGLFDTITKNAVTQGTSSRGNRGFWLGAGFGGAVAASILVLALALGWVGSASDAGGAQFTVALGEPRNMNIAIETDRALVDANISILLSGGIEIDGYGDRRELSWETNLEAGVNRLRLPVLAVDPAGGHMVVRLNHPDSKQVFIVRLNTEA